MQESDEKYMRAALGKAAEGVEKGQTPFGACIVKDGEIVSCVHNTVFADKDITAHAEVRAIREACRKLNTIDLSGCVIYSTCEPCPMCYGAIHWARISRVCYGAGIEDAKKFGFRELPIPSREMKRLGGDLVELTPGLLREEALRLFELWSKRKDKRVY